MAHPRSPGFDRHEARTELRSYLRYQTQYYPGQSGSGRAGPPHEYHSRCGLRTRKDELSEVLVLGQQDSPLLKRALDDRFVVGPRRILCYRGDIVTRAAKDTDDPEVEAFVR